ncbi:hypothetical protein V491_07538 [Pseudogymnoascus sp. VKM F-3775]|nr:hypothetical protein V491_07538 [Pseudogymnoascus sp. VKM F-3775]
MDTFEPLDTIESVIPSQVEMEPVEPAPKLKGRQRFLHSLQRISSSTSLKGLSRKRAMSNPYSSTSSRGSALSLSNIQSSQAGSSSSFARMVMGQQASTPTSGGSTPPMSMNGPLSPPIKPWMVNLGDGMPGSSLTSHPGIQKGGSDIIEVSEGYFAPQATLSAVKPRTPNPNFDFWGNLPEELRLSVLSHLRPKELVRASIVSRLFHSMCFDGQLWTCFDASEFYTAIPAESLAKIVEAAGPFVKDLNLRGCVQVEHYNRADVPSTTAPARSSPSHVPNLSLSMSPGAATWTRAASNSSSPAALNCGTSALAKSAALAAPLVSRLQLPSSKPTISNASS